MIIKWPPISGFHTSTNSILTIIRWKNTTTFEASCFLFRIFSESSGRKSPPKPSWKSPSAVVIHSHHSPPCPICQGTQKVAWYFHGPTFSAIESPSPPGAYPRGGVRAAMAHVVLVEWKELHFLHRKHPVVTSIAWLKIASKRTGF